MEKYGHPLALNPIPYGATQAPECRDTVPCLGLISQTPHMTNQISHGNVGCATSCLLKHGTTPMHASPRPHPSPRGHLTTT